MSSQSVSSAGSVSSLSAGSPLQITGLASGLDTNAIISALIAVDRRPVTNLTNQQKRLQAQNAQLTSIRTALQQVMTDSDALGAVGLFAPTQSISSSNSTAVSAAASSTSGIATVPGSYQVQVSALATSAQATYQFSAQSAANTITVGKGQYTLAAGAKVSDLAAQINADSNGSVWAAATVTDSNGDGTIVFSDRTTGTKASDITVSETATQKSLSPPAQVVYDFSTQTSPNTVTIAGQSYSLATGATVTDLAKAINADPNGKVWAQYTDDGTGDGRITFSARGTGMTAADIAVGESSSSPSLTIATDASGNPIANTQDGTLAQYSINGIQQPASAVNTITTAIPGVTLTLNALTGSAPVSVTASNPAPDATAITTAVNQFVKDYNALIDQINTQLAQRPSSSDPTQGTLFGDSDLTGLINTMRALNSMPTDDASSADGLPHSLPDIGISTGAPTGFSPTLADSLAGKLTVNAATLASAIQTNASGVRAVLQSWSIQFGAQLQPEAWPGGSIDERISGDDTEVKQLGDRIDAMNQMLQVKEQSMVRQYARLEAVLSQSQSEGAWLSSQIAGLSANG